MEVEINSLGCPKCREEFKNKLKAVLKPYFNELCEDCQKRYEKNSLRLLDCKVESCKEIFEKPEIKEVINSDFICEDCSHHYTELKLYLDRMGVKYKENKLLVRGLDYYNRTVFEIKSNNLGSQNAVAGASEAIVVTTPEMSAVRDADRIIGLLEAREEIESYKLLINRVRPNLIKSNDMMSVEDVAEILSADLIGIIPEDTGIITSTNKGEPIVNDENSLAGRAYRNVAHRIMGEEVPFLNLEEETSFMTKVKKFFSHLVGKEK